MAERLGAITINSMAADLTAFKLPTPLAVRGFRYARNAAKRCYELAGRFVLDQDGAMLVHGIVGSTRDGFTHAHAWAEIGNVVYDGTCKGFYERAGYYSVTSAQPVRSFTRAEMCCAMGDVWGPCPELVAAEARARRSGIERRSSVHALVVKA